MRDRKPSDHQHAKHLPAPSSRDGHTVDGLQRAAGNRAVSALAGGLDSLAFTVDSQLATDPRLASAAALLIQRQTTTTDPGTAAPAMPGTSVDPEHLTPPPRSLVQLGDGPTTQIGELQQRLNAVGAAAHRLLVTGVFDEATRLATQAFQAAHALPPTGIADIPTWTLLDTLAPTLRRNQPVVDQPGGANQAGAPLGTISHPTVRLGNTGPAVQELQQRLGQTSMVTSPPAVTGVFDQPTRVAVIEFQRADPPLEADGVVGQKTWAKVDQFCSGPIDQGAVRSTQRERVEGSEFVIEGRYAWRILDADRKLKVTVNMRFTHHPSHPKIASWMADITKMWNNKFVMADRADPSRAYDLEFEPVANGSPPDATIKVTVGNGRSNAGEFFTGDNDHRMAPHEFGHLLGLADEYNNPEEQYLANTGEQQHVGDVAEQWTQTAADGSTVVHQRETPENIASQLGAVLRSFPVSTRPQRLAAIKRANGMRQGGFSRRVARAYRETFAGDMKKMRWLENPWRRIVPLDPTADIADDIAARLPGTTDEQTEVTEVFLNTNTSLMGDMTSASAATAEPANSHQHPIEPRHVRHFFDLLAANRPGDWELRYK